MFINKYDLIIIFALLILATQKTRKSPWKIYVITLISLHLLLTPVG